MVTTMQQIQHKNIDLVPIYACFVISDVFNVRGLEILNVQSVRMGIISGLIIPSVRSIVLLDSILLLIWGILPMRLNVRIVMLNV